MADARVRQGDKVPESDSRNETTNEPGLSGEPGLSKVVSTLGLHMQMHTRTVSYTIVSITSVVARTLPYRGDLQAPRASGPITSL